MGHWRGGWSRPYVGAAVGPSYYYYGARAYARSPYYTQPSYPITYYSPPSYPATYYSSSSYPGTAYSTPSYPVTTYSYSSPGYAPAVVPPARYAPEIYPPPPAGYLDQQSYAEPQDYRSYDSAPPASSGRATPAQRSIPSIPYTSAPPPSNIRTRPAAGLDASAAPQPPGSSSQSQAGIATTPEAGTAPRSAARTAPSLQGNDAFASLAPSRPSPDGSAFPASRPGVAAVPPSRAPLPSDAGAPWASRDAGIAESRAGAPAVSHASPPLAANTIAPDPKYGSVAQEQSMSVEQRAELLRSMCSGHQLSPKECAARRAELTREK